MHVPAKRPDGSDNKLEALNLTHCTLVPGWAVATDGDAELPNARRLGRRARWADSHGHQAILGVIRAGEFVDVEAFDCIVDATDPTRL